MGRKKTNGSLWANDYDLAVELDSSITGTWESGLEYHMQLYK